MKIPILKNLETEQQWLAFSRQTNAYAYISSPSCLVDFQTNFLLVTDIKKNLSDGRQALKYSLGDRNSQRAAWQLIETCDWSLRKLLAGFKRLDFSSNVRDNSVLNLHSNVSIRQFFAKDKCVISPALLQPLLPIKAPPSHWRLADVKNLLSCAQFYDLQWLSQKPEFHSIKAVLLQLISHAENWRMSMHKDFIVLSFNESFILQFKPKLQQLALPAPNS